MLLAKIQGDFKLSPDEDSSDEESDDGQIDTKLTQTQNISKSSKGVCFNDLFSLRKQSWHKKISTLKVNSLKV